MEETNQINPTRVRIFLWDQFIRPFYTLTNMSSITIIVFILLGISIFMDKIIITWILFIILLIITILGLIRYYKSGEYMHHFRTYKSEKGQYSDYRKVIKEFKRGEKALQEIEIENVAGEVTATNIT